MVLFSQPVLGYVMKNLQHFVGKICTILTRPTTRIFDETQHANTFVGLVEQVDDYGIWLLQLTTRKSSFFFAGTLVGILEETVTPLSEEDARKVQQELEKRALPQSGKQELVSLGGIKKMANDAKKQIGEKK